MTIFIFKFSSLATPAHQELESSKSSLSLDIHVKMQASMFSKLCGVLQFWDRERVLIEYWI